MSKAIERLWWMLATIAPRCECGWRIWPWQKRAWDPELCMDIHADCGSPMDAPDLSPAEKATVERFGLDKPEDD